MCKPAFWFQLTWQELYSWMRIQVYQDRHKWICWVQTILVFLLNKCSTSDVLSGKCCSSLRQQFRYTMTLQWKSPQHYKRNRKGIITNHSFVGRLTLKTWVFYSLAKSSPCAKQEPAVTTQYHWCGTGRSTNFATHFMSWMLVFTWQPVSSNWFSPKEGTMMETDSGFRSEVRGLVHEVLLELASVC